MYTYNELGVSMNSALGEDLSITTASDILTQIQHILHYQIYSKLSENNKRLVYLIKWQL